MYSVAPAADPDARRAVWLGVAPLLNAWFDDFALREPEAAADVRLLLNKRESEPGMEPFLLAEMRAYEPTRKRRQELIHGFVSSVLQEGGFRTRTHSGNAESKPPIEAKTRQRIYNEEYPTLFPKLEADGRETVRTSIINPEFAAESPTLRKMGAVAMKQVGIHGTLLEPLPHETIYNLRLTHPEVIRDLNEFRKQCLTVVHQTLGPSNEAKTDHGRAFVESLEHVDDILIGFHANVTGILSAQWFLSRRPATQDEILDRLFVVNATRESVDDAFKLLHDLYGSEDAAGGIFERAAAPLIKQGSWSYAFLLFERIYLCEWLNDRLRGAVVGNMGALLRRAGHHEEAVVCLQQSAHFHAKAGDRFGLFVAFRDLGEALWRTDEGQSREALDAAMKLAKLLLRGEIRSEAMYNLQAMFERLGEPTYAAWAMEMRSAPDLLDYLPRL